MQFSRNTSKKRLLMITKITRPGSSFRKLLSRISRGGTSGIRKLKIALNMKTEYRYTDFSIALPADHLLPLYQERHYLYDKFLPHLSKYLEPKSTVIDVGANCGDTLAAMYDANSNLNYVCVEADEVFFDFLQKNVLRIKAIDENASIQTIKSLVGKHVTDVSLDGSGGTKKAIIGDSKNSISSESLDHILSHSNATNIRLLKSDVDGFDYDVIDSADSILRAYSPIIYFECHFDHTFQKTGYEKTIANLRSKGYGNWVVFDNFGEVVLRTNDIQQINQLFDYVWRQNIGRTTRTIYYFDVLTSSSKDNQLVDTIIDDYIASI